MLKASALGVGVVTCSLAESHFQSRGAGEAAEEKLSALTAFA